MTATPYSQADGTGTAGTAFTAERFTLTEAASAVSGFTLVDARGGAPDPDLGVIADGGTLDVSAILADVNIRADAAVTDRVQSVRLQLDGDPVRSIGPRTSVDRSRLFGDVDGNYRSGFLYERVLHADRDALHETGRRGPCAAGGMRWPSR